MAQTSVSIPHPIALNYDSTLVLAIETSNASWVLAAQVPGLPRLKAKQTIEPTAEGLLAAIEIYRGRASAIGHGRTGSHHL
jgi:transposase